MESYFEQQQKSLVCWNSIEANNERYDLFFSRFIPKKDKVLFVVLSQMLWPFLTSHLRNEEGKRLVVLALMHLYSLALSTHLAYIFVSKRDSGSNAGVFCNKTIYISLKTLRTFLQALLWNLKAVLSRRQLLKERSLLLCWNFHRIRQGIALLPKVNENWTFGSACYKLKGISKG